MECYPALGFVSEYNKEAFFLLCKRVFMPRRHCVRTLPQCTNSQIRPRYVELAIAGGTLSTSSSMCQLQLVEKYILHRKLARHNFHPVPIPEYTRYIIAT